MSAYSSNDANLFTYCSNNPLSYVDESGQYYTPGQIHNLVAAKICSHHPTIVWKQTYMRYGRLYRNHSYGFCDLYDTETHEIWEIKKCSGSYTCSNTYASRQLDNYINNGYFVYQEQKGGYIKGGTKTKIEQYTFIERDYISGGYYHISYWDAGDGIINYDYYYVPPKRPSYSYSGAVVFFGALFLIFCAPTLALG